MITDCLQQQTEALTCCGVSSYDSHNNNITIQANMHVVSVHKSFVCQLKKERQLRFYSFATILENVKTLAYKKRNIGLHLLLKQLHTDTRLKLCKLSCWKKLIIPSDFLLQPQTCCTYVNDCSVCQVLGLSSGAAFIPLLLC